MQQRYGPWLVGPKGLLQPVADIVKLFFKEELQPKAADRLLFSLAPIISVATCFVAFAPVPFGATTTLFGWLDEPIAAAGRRPQRRRAVRLRRRLGRRLRHRPGRLGQQLQVLAARRAAQLGADDQLRAGLRHGAGHDRDLLAGSMSFREIVDAQEGYWLRRRSRAGTSSRCSRSGSSRSCCSSPPASPRPTARRSTSRRPSRSWSPATTPSTARCASPCSSWPSTSTWSRSRPWP